LFTRAELALLDLSMTRPLDAFRSLAEQTVFAPSDSNTPMGSDPPAQ